MQLRIFTEPQQGATYEQLLAVARTAEDGGFDAFFRSDHYMTIWGDGLPGPTDAWITLAGLARDTSRIRLGTLVTPVTFRLPGPLAISVATVDQMSGGRVELGLGTGWYEGEHAAYGIPFPPFGDRFAELEEQVEIVLGLWRTPVGGRYSHSGRRHTLTDSPALPKPVQTPSPPLIIGGLGPRRTPDLAARHDPSLPWPEEEYRTAIDADADLLFAPTELAAANLRAEKVPGEIHVTGNTGIDALLDTASRLPSPSLRESGRTRLLVTCHRRESWHDGLASIASALLELAVERAEIDFVLHPNTFVAASMRQLLAGVRGIRLLAPCSQDKLLQRMRDSDLVLSDSGGMQEEAPALGVPLLVLRDKTERPEGIAAGSSRLVGTDREQIVAEVRSLLDNPVALAAMGRPVLPFGDGRAGPRIAEIISSWLQQRPMTRQRA